jgi:hypothetical protein
VYFMTEDNPSRGSNQANIITGEPFEPVGPPCSIESVVTTLPTGPDGADELWKLNHYYERLDDWYGDRGVPANPFLPPAAATLFELHNLTLDPEERHNRAEQAPDALSQMQSVLDGQRDAKRLVPALRNPVG